MDFEAVVKYCEENRIEYKIQEPMCNHTSFKIGGPADIFITVCSKQQLIEVINKTDQLSMQHSIIGRGTNMLVSDSGVEGAVISLAGIKQLKADDCIITCGAGVSLGELCRFACDNSLTGLEFAYGIPGSVGGAMYMNAGAYGGEMADVIISAEYLDNTCNIKTLNACDMDLGYRTSVFRNNNYIILGGKFMLAKGEKDTIQKNMQDILSRRQEKQPLEFPSGGSTFKRPNGYYAGSLIEKNNLKGLSVGGAEVSKKHAGFVINKGGATSKDVEELIKIIQERVYDSDGVKLEPEIIFMGRN